MTDHLREAERRLRADPENADARIKANLSKKRAVQKPEGVPPCPWCMTWETMAKADGGPTLLAFENAPCLVYTYRCKTCGCIAKGSEPIPPRIKRAPRGSVMGRLDPSQTRRCGYVNYEYGDQCELVRGHEGDHIATNGDVAIFYPQSEYGGRIVLNRCQHTIEIHHHHSGQLTQCVLSQGHDAPHEFGFVG